MTSIPAATVHYRAGGLTHERYVGTFTLTVDGEFAYVTAGSDAIRTIATPPASLGGTLDEAIARTGWVVAPDGTARYTPTPPLEREDAFEVTIHNCPDRAEDLWEALGMGEAPTGVFRRLAAGLGSIRSRGFRLGQMSHDGIAIKWRSDRGVWSDRAWEVSGPDADFLTVWSSGRQDCTVFRGVGPLVRPLLVNALAVCGARAIAHGGILAELFPTWTPTGRQGSWHDLHGGEVQRWSVALDDGYHYGVVVLHDCPYGRGYLDWSGVRGDAVRDAKQRLVLLASGIVRSRA